MVAASSFDSDLLYGKVAEILPDKLYFASFTSPPKSTPNIRYIPLEERIHYEPFYTDFGPLNLSVLFRFCEFLHSMIEHRPRRKIVITTTSDERNRVNGAYIMGAYLIIYHRVSADSAYLRVDPTQPPDYIGFRDAALGEPSYLLHLHDVLRGIEKALSHRWLDFAAFDAEEYEYYERVENGDLNWIIPGKVLSFCGPHNESRIEDGYPYHSPETYFEYFRENKVSTIIRLNVKNYDADKFVKAGFDHVDLFFIDGSTPSDAIVLKFIDIVDKAKGAVAVHCKAGLGRTGTLIACWMMKQFGITAAECMAWLRVCRPGSVIGPQQEFLVEKQKFCWSMSGAVHMAKKQRSSNGTDIAFNKLASKVRQVDDIRLSPKTSLGSKENARARPNILSVRRHKRTSGGEVVDETALDNKGRSQGDRLLQMKASRQGPSSSSSAQHNGTPPSVAHPKTNHNNNINNNHLSPRTIDSKRTPVKVGNGNSLFPQASVNPVVARSSAAASASPRFSSPTTPIKQPSPAVSSPAFRNNHLPHRNLQIVPPPISKVTVAARTTPVRLPSSSKSTSAVRKLITGVRTRPYPSQGTRVELSATNSIAGYELRSRTSPNSSPSLPASALNLPPNTEALLGVRRKKRST